MFYDMTSHKLVEDGEITGTRMTDDGYMVANVRCARTGIQEYSGFELGVNDRETVKVYRSPDEVFSTDSMKTYAHKPATDNHPMLPVTADTWKGEAVGNVGSEVMRDGDFVSVPLILMDAGTIEAVKNGKREISMGYFMDIAMESGETPEGEAYDAVMQNLRMNHLAIVQKGRAGSQVRIGDSWGATPITTNDGKPPMTLKTMVVDGLSVETTEAGEKAINKLQGDNQALKDAHDAAQSARDAEDQKRQAAHDSAIAEKDKELAAKDTEIVELKSKVLDAAALDARVAQRSALITKATALAADADFTGKTDHQIMAMAVDAVNGEGFTEGKPDAYIEAAFDLAKIPTGDTVRAVVKAIPKTPANDDNGQSAYVQRLNDGWKAKTGGAA